ncbi:hypothetical protein DM02DRAFT_275739 [Periconia macrospinosa]|uniref:CENP-V/GFA domain-containing protein n=1 Tax=Periconia macrospinosa TaxID=97972 RepID=A0A2V1DXY6_9PLEO|nr:hypothetical protein DM02DRAFT_275739 [Periconia macrospinosa]
MDISYESTEPVPDRAVLKGSCYCRHLTYLIAVENVDSIKTSMCHCTACKKVYGGAFGLTAKVPVHGFRYEVGSGACVVHVGANDAGVPVYREFCGKCGSRICEYHEGIKEHFRYVSIGSLEEPSMLPPKGEFFCSQREAWMPEVHGIPQNSGKEKRRGKVCAGGGEVGDERREQLGRGDGKKRKSVRMSR